MGGGRNEVERVINERIAKLKYEQNVVLVGTWSEARRRHMARIHSVERVQN